MFRIAQIVPLIAAAVFTGAAAAQIKPICTYGVAPGAEARFGFQEVNTVTSISETLSGGPSTHTYITESQVRVRTLDATDSGIRVELVYERIRFEADSRAMKNPPAFDTAAPLAEALENPFAPALLAVVNKPIIVFLNAAGRITSVEPPEVDVPDVEFAGVARQFLTPTWIRLRLQPIFTLGGPDPARPENEWTASVEIPMAVSSKRPMLVRSTSRVKSLDESGVTVAITSNGELLPNPEGAIDTNATLKSFRGAAAAAWDRDEGSLRSYNCEWSWSLDTLPRPDLATTIECSIKTLIVRMK